MFKNFKWILLFGTAFLLCLFEALSLAAVKLPSTESAVIFGILLLFIGYRILGQAIYASIKLEIRSVPLFITLAVLSGYLVGDRYEAMLVLLLCALAERLDDSGANGQRNALDELLEKLPNYAYLKGMDEPIDVTSIKAGQEIVIKPNHIIPLDGEVISGFSSVDEGVVTGEDQPVEKRPGSKIFAATFNRQGTLYVRVSKPLNKSILAQMHAEAERFLQNKSSSLRIEERVVGYYAILVFLVSLVLTFFSLLNGTSGLMAVGNSLRFLLIACPSAVILSGPLATFFASMYAERLGLRVHSYKAFQAFARIKTLVFTYAERSVLLPSLKKIGITAGLLTGIRELPQEAKIRGFKTVKTALLPVDKVNEYEKLAKRGDETAFVGEGISDLPTLAAANMSISIVSSLENSTNISTASLLEDRLSELPHCIELARRSTSLTHLNAIIGAGIKAFAIGLFLLGAISSPGAIFMDLIAVFLIAANCAQLRR